MTPSEYRRKLENHGYDHDEVEVMVSSYTEYKHDEAKDRAVEEQLARLQDAWLQDVPL